MLYHVQSLETDDDWAVLRHLRLLALQDSPHAFVDRYDEAFHWDEAEWRRQFSADHNALVKGSPHWFVVHFAGYLVGVLCLRSATEGLDLIEGAMPLDALRFVESLWVRRSFRRTGAGRQLLRAAAEHYRPLGVRYFRAWLLKQNEDAGRFYLRLGFSWFGVPQAVPGHPELEEQCMQIAVDALAEDS